MTLLFFFALHGTMVCYKILHRHIFFKVSRDVLPIPFPTFLEKPVEGTYHHCQKLCLPVHPKSSAEGSEMVHHSSNNSLCLCGNVSCSKVWKMFLPQTLSSLLKMFLQPPPKAPLPRRLQLIRDQERDMFPPITFVSSSQVSGLKLPQTSYSVKQKPS